MYRKPKLFMPPPATDSSVFTVESVMPTSDESLRRGSHSLADRELLIRNVLEAMGTRRDIISGRRRNITVITGCNSCWVSDDTSSPAARCIYLGNTPCVLLIEEESTENRKPGSIDVDACSER